MITTMRSFHHRVCCFTVPLVGRFLSPESGWCIGDGHKAISYQTFAIGITVVFAIDCCLSGLRTTWEMTPEEASLRHVCDRSGEEAAVRLCALVQE